MVCGSNVRRAAPTDSATVRGLVASAPVPRYVTEDELSIQFAEPTRSDGTGDWVVDMGGSTVGYVALALPADGSTALELSVYLDGAVQGKGLGTELVNAFAKPAAAEAGVGLLTAVPHTTAAVRLLEKTGFALRHPPPQSSDPLAAKLQNTNKVNQIWDCGCPWP